MIHLDHLPGTLPGEKTLALLRRHWVTMFSLIVSLCIVVLLPFIAIIGLQLLNPEFFSDPIRLTLFALGGSIFFLFALLFLYQNYIDYYLDMWIVTDHRILDMEQNGLFARTVSELRLDRIQDVTAEIKGFIRTMFDFGYVYIQTAGEKERFVFEDVTHPNQVAKMILDLADTSRREHLETAVEEFGIGEKQEAKR